jgi:hypothetical protein
MEVFIGDKRQSLGHQFVILLLVLMSVTVIGNYIESTLFRALGHECQWVHW